MRQKYVLLKELAGLEELLNSVELITDPDCPEGSRVSGNVIIDKEKFFIIRNLSGYGARPIRTVAFLLTARQ